MDFADFITIICGGCILLWLIIRRIVKRCRCTVKVRAICVDHKRRYNKPTYTPIYEIYWQGNKIQVNNSVYIGRFGKLRPAVGKEVWLRINPNNPLEFISHYDYQEMIAPILVALIFILMPIYFTFFHKYY